MIKFKNGRVRLRGRISDFMFEAAMILKSLYKLIENQSGDEEFAEAVVEIAYEHAKECIEQCKKSNKEMEND